ncbi:MAG: HEAT repeat domain-containing protein [Kofleriaceae bacterium]|nr:HEAT repeat domain-containing protein [Kofleriaceae bacterium]
MKIFVRRSWFVATLFIGLSGSGIAGCASATVRASVSHYEAGDYAASRKAANTAIEHNASDDDAWRMKLRAELALGDAAAMTDTYAAYQRHRRGDDVAFLRELAQATLAQGLNSPAPRVRMAAVAGVEEAHLEALADKVYAALYDKDPQVAVTAAVAVINSHPDAALIAENMLTHDDPAVRRIAINGVGKKVGKSALADLRAAATDRDPGARRAAIRWLSQLDDADSVDTLRGRLRDKDDGVRGAAAVALAKIVTSHKLKLDLTELARAQLSLEGLATRLGAIELAKATGADDLLRPLAQDDDTTVALAAVTAMASKDQTLVLAVFERARKAENYAARAGAINVAARAIGDAAALPFYTEMTQDPHPAVRLAAARALANATRKDPAQTTVAFAVFASILEASAEFDDRLSAATDLAMYDDSRGAAALGKFVSERTLTADQRAAAAAAHRMGRVVTAGLVAALADASGQVRIEAARVLLARK